MTNIRRLVLAACLAAGYALPAMAQMTNPEQPQPTPGMSAPTSTTPPSSAPASTGTSNDPSNDTATDSAAPKSHTAKTKKASHKHHTTHAKPKTVTMDPVGTTTPADGKTDTSPAKPQTK